MSFMRAAAELGNDPGRCHYQIKLPEDWIGAALFRPGLASVCCCRWTSCRSVLPTFSRAVVWFRLRPEW
jgi:hypothetical protein